MFWALFNGLWVITVAFHLSEYSEPFRRTGGRLLATSGWPLTPPPRRWCEAQLENPCMGICDRWGINNAIYPVFSVNVVGTS